MALTKYVVELPPREFKEMILDLQNAIVGYARMKLALKKTLGNAHPDVLTMSADIARAERAVAALKLAQHLAENPQPPVTRRETPARNVGDELPLVYGRPRNDPRTPKRKI